MSDLRHHIKETTMLFQNNATGALAQDAGLAAHMRMIFNYMAGGVALSGLVAWLTLKSPEALQFAVNANLILFLVWFGVGMLFHKIAFNTQPTTALAMFAGYSALTGFMLAPLALVYAQADITLAFLAAAGTFGAASLYGYTTGRSLASLGSFLAVGGIALMVFAVVLIGMSIFSTVPAGLSLVFSVLVIPFVLIAVAYKMNQIRETYHHYGNDELMSSRMAIMNALGFYTDFVVLFVHILNILGAARR
ncbi:MAG: hypothetical protein CMF62_10275 [Magnetococcales bacterium]|nr:hypothetical protein [Magnetococcales bacterium]